MKPLVLTLLCLFLGPAGHAQIATSGAYVQNFDSLASSGTLQAWTNNSTLSGWYSSYNFSSTPGRYLIRSGLSNGTEINSYGSDSDRGLGAGGTSGGSSTAIGVRFVNSTLQPVLGFSVNFDGEQWGRKAYATPVADTLYFSYKIYTTTPGGSGLLNNTAWVDIPALNFTSPNWSDPAATNLDGNAAENRVGDIYSFISGITLLAGQELWLRWVAYGDSAGNHDLAIDNLSVNFFTTSIPEPASVSIILGLVVFGIAGRRRLHS